MLTRIKNKAGALLSSSTLGSQRFGTDQRGNIAIMTAFTLTMVLVGVGAALDFSRAVQRNHDLQNFADAAVLAGASARGKSEAEVRAQALAVVKRHNTQGWDLDIKIDVTDERVMVTVGSATPSIMGGFMNRQETDIQVVSASPRAQLVPIHLALVLDTTDSMEGDNLTAMQAAANALIDEMDDLKADVKLSVVPFGQYVNVGFDKTKPETRSWLDMGKYGQSYNHCWTPKIEVEKEVCTNMGKESYDDIVDGRNRGKKMRDKWDCKGGKWVDGPEKCEIRTYDWHGCMGSRADKLSEKPRYDGALLPAALDEHCGSEMLPLSNDFTAMRDTVNGLATSGPTYLPSGLIWGWRSLDPGQPYPEANQTSSPRLKRAMLFMTDGLNTRSIGDSSGNANGVKHRFEGEGGKDGTKKTEDVCKEAKADGIELFVVAYKFPDQADERKVLEKCATSDMHFFSPDTAADLTKSFKEVAAALDSTRLEF